MYAYVQCVHSHFCPIHLNSCLWHCSAVWFVCKHLDVYRCMVCMHIVMHIDVWYVCKHLCTHTCTCCSHFDIKAQFDANRLFHLFSHCNHGPLSTSGLLTTSQLSKSRLWTSSRLASPVCRQSWGQLLPIGGSDAT